MNPKSRGTYVLLVELGQEAVITVGQLGTFCFPAGYYVYVGSALGSGGLAARLARHRRRDKKLRWHIDYFLAHARILDIRTDDSGKRLECAWVCAMLSTPGAQVVAPRFGASDCSCPSHLVYFGDTGLDLQSAAQTCETMSPVVSTKPLAQVWRLMHGAVNERYARR